jgi:hypothetical protein
MSFVRTKGVHVGVILALLLSLAASTAIAGESQQLTKKELKTLLATAKTSTDQQKLAAHDHEKARQLTAKAQDFAEHADLLATEPATVESKQGISCQCTSRYRYFSKRFSEEAKEAENQAAQHDHLAQQLSKGAVQN